MKKALQLIFVFIVLFSTTFSLHAQNPYLPKNNEEVVMYQVNIRAFSENGTLAGVINRLDHIKDLGTNVIYLMPIFETEASPYAATDYMKLDAEYGTVNDLTNLINQAHQKGMAVIMDIATNHTGTNHVWLDDEIKNYWWYQQSHNTGEQGVHGPPPAHPGWTDVYQLDFDNADLRDTLISVLKYWINTVDCDGFRFDYTDGQDVMLNDGNTDPSNFKFQFWKQVINELRGMQKDLLLLAEGDGNEYFELDFDLIYGNAFFYEFKNRIFTGNPVGGSMYYANGFDFGATNGQLPIRFTANHDTHAHYGTPAQLFGGNKGQMSAFVVGAYMRGVPMIFSGQEVNTPESVPFYSKDVRGTINWSGLNGAIHQEYKNIIQLRKESDAIKYGELTDFNNDDICAFMKKMGEEEVLVVANFRDGSRSVDIPQVARGEWRDAFTNSNETVGGNMTMEAFSYKVYRRGEVIAGNTGNESNNSIQIYPNPAQNYVTVENAGKLHRIYFYNNIGNLVKISEEIKIDISDLDAGNYLLRIVTDTETITRSIVKQ